MRVYEVLLKVYLLEDIILKDAQTKIFKFIDKTLAQTEETLEFHNNNQYKNYCFNSFYPLEKDGVYKEDKIYSIIIRTTRKDLAIYFNNKLADITTKEIKGLKTDLKTIPLKKIKRIYSITPVVIKNDEGYWKSFMSFDHFKIRLKENLIKKYNDITNGKVNEDFKLFSQFKIDNSKPIATLYKQRSLLGDKLSLDIAEDELSQEFAYMALGTGIGEMNARGFGFVGYRWQ